MPLNQFGQKVLAGMVDQTINPTIHTFQSNNATDINAGDLVTVVATPAGRVPMVARVASVTTAGQITGVVCLDPKKDVYKIGTVAGPFMQVALPGSVIYVKFTNAAVAANLRVAFSATGLYKVAVSTNQAIGITWNDVAANGIGRILVIKPEIMP